MAWTLHSKTIHPADGEDGGRIEANYAIQDVLDGTTSVISYYGAKSQIRQMQFVLDETENSGTGLSGLISATTAGTTVALVGDGGALGNWKIVTFEYRRMQALNKSDLVYKCSVELIAQ